MRLSPTPFTRLVGCRLPIQQAGMGAVTTPALAAAVAAEGGLGMIAAPGLTANQVDAQVRAALDLAGHGARIGVNFLMPFLDHQALEAASQVAELVECFYGDPDPAIVARVHDGDALAAWQVGSFDEALAAAHAGCDVIVVQGREAGGHVRGNKPLLPLLDNVRATVYLPLVAAGGIGSGAALVAADAGDTVLTEAFSLGWPNAPHRVLRGCLDASDVAPAMRSPLPPTRSFAGDVTTAALYAGKSVGDVVAVLPAGHVIRQLVRDTESVLRAAAAGR